MTGDQVEALLARATSDDDFMDRLVSDPRAAAADLGVELSDDEAAAIGGMSADDVRAFADEYRAATDPEKRRAAC